MTKYNVTVAEAIARADAYRTIGDTTVYLSEAPYPWEYVTSCEPGGSHRLECDTSVRFVASHPSGLVFQWTVELEHRTANGKGHYEVDTSTVLQARKALEGNPVRVQYDAYLERCAIAIRDNADKALEWLEREYGAVEAIRRLIQAPTAPSGEAAR